MRRPPALIGMLAMALLVNGCLFDPFGRQVGHLQTRVVNLDTRVGQLETTRMAGGGTTASVSTGGSSLVGTDLGAGASEVSTTSEVATTGGQGTMVITGPSPEGARWPGLTFNFRRAIGKLGRGIVNLITGWVEIPKGIYDVSQRHGVLSGLTLGTLRGTGYGFIRTVAGGYEAVTFPFPAPPHYRPVMRPEFIFTCECDQATPP